MREGFEMGRTFATPEALERMWSFGVEPGELIERHARGDWGELDAEDVRENEIALREGLRILSSYPICDETGCEDHRIWVLTEADRSRTTLLRPEDY